MAPRRSEPATETALKEMAVNVILVGGNRASGAHKPARPSASRGRQQQRRALLGLVDPDRTGRAWSTTRACIEAAASTAAESRSLLNNSEAWARLDDHTAC